MTEINGAHEYNLQSNNMIQFIAKLKAVAAMLWNCIFCYICATSLNWGARSCPVTLNRYTSRWRPYRQQHLGDTSQYKKGPRNWASNNSTSVSDGNVVSTWACPWWLFSCWFQISSFIRSIGIMAVSALCEQYSEGCMFLRGSIFWGLVR